jgi:tetratricopeptide (TPR) repeat protein
LAKSFFYMGRFDQSLALLGRVTDSGFCDARFIEHEIRTLVQDSAGQGAVAETILNECGSIGWYHLATLTTGSGPREVSIRDQAMEMLEPYARWHTHASGIHLALARSDLSRGNWEGAEAQYLKAIGFNPLNSSAHLESAGLSRATGDLQSAQSRLAQPHGYSRAYALAVLSEINAFQNDFDEARNLLERARTSAGGDPVISTEIGNAAIRQHQDFAAAESMNTAIASRPQFGLGHWYPYGELMLGDAWLGRWVAAGSNMDDAFCRTAEGHQRFVSDAYHKYVLLSTASALLAPEQPKNDRSLIRDGIRLIRDFISVEQRSLHERTELVTSLINSGNIDQAISLMRATTTYYHQRSGLSALPSFETLVAESEKEVWQRLRRLSDVSEILDRLEAQITTDEFSEFAGLSFADPELRRSALRDVLISLIPYEYWWTPRETGRVLISLIKAEACSGRQSEALEWAIDTFGRRALSSDVVVISAQLGAFRDFETEIRELKRVTSLEPGNYWALFELGRALRESGQHEEAIDVLRQATSLAPGFAIGYMERSLAYNELGYTKTAELLSRQAQAIEPGWHRLYANPYR